MTRGPRLIVSSVAIAALALSARPGAAGEPPLGLDEVRELLVGNTVHGTGAQSGWFFAIYYRPDGVASGKSSRVKGVDPVYYGEGRWEITSENGYCLQWRHWQGGRKRCMNMYRQGTGFEFRTPDGVRQSVVRVLKGNPDGL